MYTWDVCDGTCVKGTERGGKQWSDQVEHCRPSIDIGVYPKSNGLLLKACKQCL